MKLVKEVIGRVMAIWAIILFIVTMFIALPFILITGWLYKEPAYTASFVKIARVWMRIFLCMIGCPVTARGREKFKKGENYIVLCNHNSLMDVPLSSPEIPGANKTIAKIEMSKIPIFGMLYKRGSVLVDRKSDESRRKSFDAMKKVLAAGMHMCIYPEGTRNKTNEPLKSFYDGAFRLAIDTKKPIIPAVIFNTKRALPADKPFFLWPTPIAIHFLDPVYVTENDTVGGLKEKLFGIMKEFYTSNSEK